MDACILSSFGSFIKTQDYKCFGVEAGLTHFYLFFYSVSILLFLAFLSPVCYLEKLLADSFAILDVSHL